MRGITIKLPEALLEQLAAEARASGRSVAAVIRERLGADAPASSGSVFERTADLAGSLAGSRKSATNDRRRFRRP